MINDGGPAYPIIGDAFTTERGMTLRDYFAAHAPPPPEWFKQMGFNTPEHVVRMAVGHIDAWWAWRYFYADAMIAERTKEKP